MKHGGDLWADQQTVTVSVYPHLEGDSVTVTYNKGSMT
jgi:hypothetical protein